MKKLLILLALGAIIVPVIVFSQSRVPVSISSESRVPANISSKSSVPPAFPHKINYQGMVTDNGGVPITGYHDFLFKIFDDPETGSMLWDEPQNGVYVEKGLFNVILGSVDPVDLSFYEADEFWLDITVDGEQMPDRLNFVSVAFAYRCLKADSAEADPDWTISGNDMYSAVSGNVGIGQPGPAQKLDVNGTVQMTGFKMPTGASFGYVLTSDAGGGGTWAPAPSGGIGGSGTTNYIPIFTSSTTLGNSVIYQDGSNVGIGTTVADYTLEVSGSAAFNDYLYHNGDGNTYIRFTTDQIDLVGGGVQMITADETTQDVVVINEGSADVDFRVESDLSSYALFVRGSDGNVGIGTSSPDERLHVAGDIRLNAGGDIAFYDNNTRIYESGDDLFLTADDDLYLRPDDDIYIRADAGSDWVRFDNGNQRLGIGTTSPSDKLTVQGDVRINSSGGSQGLDLYTSSNVGIVNTYGSNGNRNVRLTFLTSYPNNGYVSVRDASDVIQAGMYVNSSGNGIVFGDTKSFRISNPGQPGTEIWYACPEGPEAAAYVRGTGHLSNGKAEIVLPDHFVAVASPQGITVQLTPLSAESKGLAVVEKAPDRFVVRELASGDGSYDFDYMVMAVRKGHEDYQVIRSALEGRPAEDGPGPEQGIVE